MFLLNLLNEAIKPYDLDNVHDAVSRNQFESLSFVRN